MTLSGTARARGKRQTEGADPHRGLVTFVIAAYNMEKYIGETIDSVLAQTYGNYEAIVIDDGSTDRTAEIVEKFAGRDRRIHLIRQSNRGLSAARNACIAEARGKYLLPLDADDFIHPETLARLVDAIAQAGPDVAGVYSWCRAVDLEGRIINSRFEAPRYEGDIYCTLLLCGYIFPGSVILRTAHTREVGGYDLAFRGGNEDTQLYMKLARTYSFRNVPAFLAAHRERPGSMLHDVWSVMRTEDRLLEFARKEYPGLPRRLYRWSEAHSCFTFARMALRSGRILSAIRLSTRMIGRDPAILVRQCFWYAIMAMARRRFGWKIGADATEVARLSGQPFLSVSPEAGTTGAGTGGTFSTEQFDFAKSVKVHSRTHHAVADSDVDVSESGI